MSCRLQNEKVATASDDEFDAWIAWYLAHCWLNRGSNSPVMLLGDAEHGSFLLPQDGILRDEFAKFAGGAAG
jgi:predicted RNase H-like nuclease